MGHLNHLLHVADFEQLNHELLKAGAKTFVNPRNSASGFLRQKDTAVTAQRPLRFAVHSRGALSDDQKIETHARFIEVCKSYRLPVLPTEICRTAEEAIERYRRALELQSRAYSYLSQSDLDLIMGGNAAKLYWDQ